MTKVHKSSAQESHSLGGVLIEQDEQLLHELKKDVSENVGPSSGSAGLQMRDDRPARRDGGGGDVGVVVAGSRFGRCFAKFLSALN